MKSGTVIVRLIFPEAISGETAMACLTDEDQLRPDRFRFRDDATHWIACRAGLRLVLGEAIRCEPRDVPLVTSKFGKPGLLPPYDWLHFNLSHCGDLALVALSIDGPVGVDIEAKSRADDLLECESTFCHPEEIKSLPIDPQERAPQLLRIWTAKEAVLKALGTGLSHPPEAVRIHFGEPASVASSDIPLSGIEDQGIRQLQHPLLTRHQAAVSSVPATGSIEIVSRELNL